MCQRKARTVTQEELDALSELWRKIDEPSYGRFVDTMIDAGLLVLKHPPAALYRPLHGGYPSA